VQQENSKGSAPHKHFEMSPSQRWTWSSTGVRICAWFFPRHGNSLSHVARLVDEYLVDSLDDRVLRAACEFGASPVDLDFLLFRTVPDWRKVVQSAVKGGYLHVVRWVTEHQDSRRPWEADFDDAKAQAAHYGHLEIVKWLHEREIDSIHWCALSRAIGHGRLRVVKWLLREGVKLTDYDQQRLRHAAQNGHVTTVRWVHENVMSADTSYAMAGAARNGDLSLLQWLHQLKRCSEARLTRVTTAAVSGGNFRVVEWLFDKCSRSFSGSTANEAAETGNLPMLQWLHERHAARFHMGTTSNVASQGHLEVLEWLHEHGSAPWTSYAMDVAAENGHFDVVRWLHANRTEGCSTRAMDKAARGGHLAIVKWLHENRSEGCSDVAMWFAARNGHVDVLRWLVEHYPDKCRDSVMEIAGFQGHLDVVRYLDKSTKQRASRWGLGAATSRGWLKTLQVLIQNVYRDDDTLRGDILRAVRKAFDKILTQLANQHATPSSSLWAEALETLELFQRRGYNSCVCVMLERALKRGHLPLVQQCMRNRGSTEKCKYVFVAAERRNVVFLRWLERNGTPINTSSAIQLATGPSSVEYVEVAGYLSESDRAQLVCQAVASRWYKLLLWTLDNTKVDDDSSRAAICNAIKQASSDVEQWLRDNLANTEALQWCV